MEKIYDIIPPKIGKEQKDYFPERKIQKASFRKKKFWIILACFVLAGTGAAFFIEPEVEIDIWPKTQVKTYNLQIQISKDLKGPDFSNNLIPGRVVVMEKVVSEEFPASQGVTKAVKARGIIRVYNDYSVYPQSFVAQTRFTSDSGKVFITLERITVPGKGSKNGKWESGFVDIKVVAAEPGPEYNISPSTFSIPGLKGTPLYTFFYAKSFELMEGGEISQIFQVSEEDLKEAEEKVTEKALSESKSRLIKEIPVGWILLEDMIESEIVEISPLAQAGQGIESFTVKAEAKSSGWIFKEEDLEQFSQAYISANLEAGQKIHPPSLKKEFSPLSKNAGDNRIVLNLSLSAKVYQEIDEEFLKRQALGKKAIQIQRDILGGSSEIERVKVELWPIWQNSASIEIENIEVNLRFEE